MLIDISVDNWMILTFFDGRCLKKLSFPFICVFPSIDLYSGIPLKFPLLLILLDLFGY